MSFPELVFLESLLDSLQQHARVEQVATIPYAREQFPIYTLSFGSTDPAAPTLALIGGVHGQEKIGSQVVLSYLETLTELLQWDGTIHDILAKSRIVFLPIVNPVGMFLLNRHNGNGIDIMRNSPVESVEAMPFVGGQRIASFLPWYRGVKGAPMEPEAQALCDFIRREVFSSKTAIALDCHSGYGAVDRLWFPYAYTSKPFEDIAEAYALKCLLDNTYPNNVYQMEPSTQGYAIGGDIWDFLYLEHQKESQGTRKFLPITLEMGSWLWLKKNPIQLFSAMGFFHPMHLHRHKRILRRHITLLDFFHKAVISPQRWAWLEEKEKQEFHHNAIDHWYFK